MARKWRWPGGGWLALCSLVHINQTSSSLSSPSNSPSSSTTDEYSPRPLAKLSRVVNLRGALENQLRSRRPPTLSYALVAVRHRLLSTSGSEAATAAMADMAMTGYLTHGCSLSNADDDVSPRRIWPNLTFQLVYTYQPMAPEIANGITTAKKMATPDVRFLSSNSSS
jgi:hypothetical protein